MTRSVLAAAVLLLAACDDSTRPPAPGTFSATLNGNAWRGSAAVHPGPADGPTLSSRARIGGTEYTVFVDLSSLPEGTEPIRPGGAWLNVHPANGQNTTISATSGTLTLARQPSGGLRGTVDARFEASGATYDLRDGEFVVAP